MRLAIQSVTSTQDLIIRVLARVIAETFMDHFQKLTDNRLKMFILQLLDLRWLETEFTKQCIQWHLIAVDYTQQLIQTCELYLEIHVNSLPTANSYSLK